MQAGDADEGEAAFFLDFVGVGGKADGAGVGDEAVFHADHGHVGEFEAFGGVEGHEGDGSSAVFDFVDIGDEGDLLEIIVEGAFGVLRIEFGGDVDELADVAEAVVAGVRAVAVGVIGFFGVLFEAGFADDAFHEAADAAGEEEGGF